MFAWAVAVSLVLVLLLIWSALYQGGLLSGRDEDAAGPSDRGPQSVSSEPTAEK